MCSKGLRITRALFPPTTPYAPPTAETRICSAAILFVVTNHKMAATRVWLLVIFSTVWPFVWGGQTILFTRKNVDELSEGEWMVEL